MSKAANKAPPERLLHKKIPKLRLITPDMCPPKVLLTPEIIPVLIERDRLWKERQEKERAEEERLAALWEEEEKERAKLPPREGPSRVKRNPFWVRPIKSIGRGMIKIDNIILTKYQIAQFWDQVRKTDDPNGCWVWTGECSPSGHGLFRAKYKTRSKSRPKYAHRISYMLKHDQVAEGVHILQKCGLAPCCNPLHLYEGSAEENEKNIQSYMDMIDRLTDQEKEEIITSNQGMAELARRYKVTLGIIWAIKFGKPGERRGKWWEWF